MGALGQRQNSRRPRFDRQHPPIDTTTVDWWLTDNGSVSLASGAVDSWRGGLRQTPVPFVTTRPTYAVDGSNARGRRAIQAVHATGAALYANLAASPLFLTGTRPWWYSVLRTRSVPAQAPYAISWGVHGGAVVGATWEDSGFPANKFGKARAAGGNITISGDTVAHHFQIYADGTLAHLKVDASDATVADTGAIASDVNAVGFGCSVAAPTNAFFVGDASHWFSMGCSATPSAAFIARLDAWVLKSLNV